MVAAAGFQIPYAPLAQTVLPNIEPNQSSFILKFIKAGLKISVALG